MEESRGFRAVSVHNTKSACNCCCRIATHINCVKWFPNGVKGVLICWASQGATKKPHALALQVAINCICGIWNTFLCVFNIFNKSIYREVSGGGWEGDGRKKKVIILLPCTYTSKSIFFNSTVLTMFLWSNLAHGPSLKLLIFLEIPVFKVA